MSFASKTLSDLASCKKIADITNTMLTSSLRELEKDGLVSRIQYNEIPSDVE